MADDGWDGTSGVPPGLRTPDIARGPTAPAEAARGEVQFELTWARTSPDGLTGELIATNVSARTWRLTGKPVITPLSPAGKPLQTQHVVTTEALIPGYVEVGPGKRARARVSWGWWDGTGTSDRVRVGWDGGTSVVSAAGPSHPERATREHRMTTSSDWWHRAD